MRGLKDGSKARFQGEREIKADVATGPQETVRARGGVNTPVASPRSENGMTVEDLVRGGMPRKFFPTLQAGELNERATEAHREADDRRRRDDELRRQLDKSVERWREAISRRLSGVPVVGSGSDRIPIERRRSDERAPSGLDALVKRRRPRSESVIEQHSMLGDLEHIPQSGLPGMKQ